MMMTSGFHCQHMGLGIRGDESCGAVRDSGADPNRMLLDHARFVLLIIVSLSLCAVMKQQMKSAV